MEFTFSVLLHFMSELKNENVSDSVICNSLFDVLVPDEVHTISPKTTSRYKTEGKPLDEKYIESVKRTPFGLLHERVKEKLLCHLNPRLFREFIAATRKIISSVSFPGSTCIGEFDVYSILNNNHVCFSSYLTWLIVFSIQFFSNRKEDGINYELSEMAEEALSIILTEENQIHGAPIGDIKLTLNPDRFNRTFIEHKHCRTAVNPESSMRFFSTESSFICYDYRELEKYIQGIIHKYVRSRAELDLIDDEDLASIIYDAMKEVRKAGGENTHFRQILVFACLESVLNAPKIMSAFEQKKYYGDDNIGWEGMHILNLPDEAYGSQYQIVFGLSSLNSDLKTAVDKAIDNIALYSRTDDQRFIAKLDRKVLRLPYNDRTRNEIHEIFGDVRHRSNNRKKAYAVVILYTLQGDEDEISDMGFSDYEKKRIQKDIDEIIPYIKKRIQEKGYIAKMPLHFYFLPFNNVEKDSITIMKNILE